MPHYKLSRISHLLKTSLLFIVICSFTNSAFSYRADWDFDYLGPISASTGGAGIAAIDPGESSKINPASLTHIKNYYVVLKYFNLPPAESSSSKRHSTYGIGVVDGGKSAKFPGAFNYNYNSNSIITEHSYALSLAGQVARKVSIGLTAHYDKRKTQSKKIERKNFDFGILFTPVRRLGLGIVGYDILDLSDDGFNEFKRLGTGLHAMAHRLLRLRLDYTFSLDSDFEYKSLNLGTESILGGDFRLRIGYQSLEINDDFEFFTAGIGWDGPKLKFNYAVRLGIDGKNKDKGHYFDIWMNL